MATRRSLVAVSRLASRFFLAALSLLWAAAPRAHAAEPPEDLVGLLALGVGEEVVAEIAGCPDPAWLSAYLFPEDGFALVKAPFHPDPAAVQQASRTPLAAEKRGLVADAIPGFRKTGPEAASPADLGRTGFRLSTFRGTSGWGRPSSSWWDPFGDPLADPVFDRFGVPLCARHPGLGLPARN
jgi:hypothetical protein